MGGHKLKSHLYLNESFVFKQHSDWELQFEKENLSDITDCKVIPCSDHV